MNEAPLHLVVELFLSYPEPGLLYEQQMEYRYIQPPLFIYKN